MKKALGVLFARPYRSHEAHGTLGPECLSWSWFNSSACPRAGGLRPRPRLPDPPSSTHTRGSATVGAAHGKRCLSVHQGVLVRVSRSLPPISRESVPGRGSVPDARVLGPELAPGVREFAEKITCLWLKGGGCCPGSEALCCAPVGGSALCLDTTGLQGWPGRSLPGGKGA